MEVNFLFLVIASIIGMGFFASYVFRKTKVPDLLLLLLLGLLIGPVFQVFERQLFVDVIPYVSALALLMILFNGGLNLKLDKLINKVPRGLALAVLGFLFSSLAVGGISFYMFNLEFLTALLLGVIVGGVSSAIVIPVVSGLDEFRDDPKLILDIESVITDPLCIIVAIVLMDLISGSGGSAMSASLSPGISRIVSMFSVSLVAGLALGIVWLEVLQHIKGERYHYMVTLSFLFFVYAGAEMIGGNGAIASFMVGIVLGNAKSIRKMFNLEKKYFGLTERTKEFQSQVSFFVKTFFFVILGMIITFNRPILFAYGALFTIVILATRYFAVEISSIGTDFKRIEKGVMIFMTPRGLAAAVLASVPMVQYGIKGSTIFPEIVFSVILGTALVSAVGVFFTGKKIQDGSTDIPEGNDKEMEDLDHS